MATKAAASLRARMAVGTVATVVMGKLKTTRMMVVMAVMMVMTTFSQKGFLVERGGKGRV